MSPTVEKPEITKYNCISLLDTKCLIHLLLFYCWFFFEGDADDIALSIKVNEQKT